MFHNTAATVWRDFVTDGVPSSGKHKVSKAEVRALLTYLESTSSAAAGASKVYTSKASLQADLVPGANTPAIVIGDSTPGNDGLYMKVGATTTGSWTQLTDFVPGTQIVHAVDAGAGTPNAIVATTDLGLSTSGAQIIRLDVYEPNTGTPVTVQFNGGSALTIKTASGNDIVAGGLAAGPVLGVVSGSTFRLLSDQASAAIVAAAEAAQVAASASEAAASGYAVAAQTAAAALVFLTANSLTSAATLNLSAFDAVQINRFADDTPLAPAVYRKVSQPANVEPSHAAKFQDTSGAWFAMVADGTVNIAACGAKPGNYGVDNGAAIQLAHDLLPDGGGRIYVPCGAGRTGSAAPYAEANRWALASALVFTKPVTIIGDGWESSVLYWNGPRDTTAITAGIYGISFEDVAVRGASDADTTVYVLGSEVVRSQGDIRTLRCDFSFFERFSTWNGGYYHKHIGSKFHRFKTIFQNYTANNVQFSTCYFSRFERLILCNGGMGPVTFLGCSIEAWTGIAIGSTGGATFAASLFGCYVENYPDLATEKGIGTDGATYNSGYLCSNGNGNLTLIGNAISTKGIIRVLTSGGASAHVVSLGNRYILFDTGSNATLTQMFNASAGYTLYSLDHIEGTPPAGATWNSATVNGYGVNPFTNAPISYSPGVTTVATDANFTLTPGSSSERQIHTGTLTADRTVTLTTTNAVTDKTRYVITRKGAGNFRLILGSTGVSLGTGEWAEVVYNGSAFEVTRRGRVTTPKQSISTDAAVTLISHANPPIIEHTGTLTADRAVTLSTTGAVEGDEILIKRTGSGAFNLNVGTGPLKALTTGTWARFRFDGVAWELVASGAL